MGYAKRGSVPSMVAGCSVGLLCESRDRPSPQQGVLLKVDAHILAPDGLGAYKIQNRQPYGVELALLASVVLGGASIPRAIRLKKPVPIMLSLLSTFGAVTFGNALRQGA